jgi:hypothetical protein
MRDGNEDKWPSCCNSGIKGFPTIWKALPKILLKFLFLFYWIFNDKFFKYWIISQFKSKRYKTTLVQPYSKGFPRAQPGHHDLGNLNVTTNLTNYFP